MGIRQRYEAVAPHLDETRFASVCRQRGANGGPRRHCGGQPDDRDCAQHDRPRPSGPRQRGVGLAKRAGPARRRRQGCRGRAAPAGRPASAASIPIAMPSSIISMHVSPASGGTASRRSRSIPRKPLPGIEWVTLEGEHCETLVDSGFWILIGADSCHAKGWARRSGSGASGLSGRQSALHPALRLRGRAALPGGIDPRCRQRLPARLGHGQPFRTVAGRRAPQAAILFDNARPNTPASAARTGASSRARSTPCCRVTTTSRWRAGARSPCCWPPTSGSTPPTS